MNDGRFSDLVGLTLTEVVGATKDSDSVTFTVDDGREFVLNHDQDCCEHVRVADVMGDPADLVGSPILFADESSSDAPDASESGTWTFYRIGTLKGTLVIRWLGESNGYYSERVGCYMRPSEIEK